MGNVSGLLQKLKKADGGIAMNIKEFSEAQYGLPLRHYCLQYLFGSTGLRYGGFYLTAGKPKSCKSPFVFWLCKEACAANGVACLYELEGKASPTLLKSMFSDHPDWVEEDESPFNLFRGMTLDKAEQHLIKVIIKVYKENKAYDSPLLIDWDSISGSAMTDVVDKLSKDGTAGKGFYDKAHVVKYLSENWSVLIGNLPIIFVGVLQEKESAATNPMAGPVKSYGGGSSQLFKAGTLLSFACRNYTGGTGKIVTIKTAMNGFADARKIETKFVWQQFGDLETESQGHQWLWAECSARCLATPEFVGELRDIADVKLSDKGLVTCSQLDVDKVTPEEFEASLFSEEHKDILEQLYRYQKIEKIKPPEEYPAFIDRCSEGAAAAKAAEKEAKAQAKAEKEAEEQAKADAKQARKEAKAKKSLSPIEAMVKK